MHRKKLAIATILATSAFAASAYAAPNLVLNGDFTDSGASVSTQFGTSATVSPQQFVTDWTGNNGYNLWFPSASAASTENAIGQYTSSGLEKLYPNVVASPDGGAFVGLDGEQVSGVQGAISQTINGLVAGNQYTLSFDWAASQVQSRTGPTTEQFEASIGGTNFFTPVINNPSQGFTGWFTPSFTFTATAASELLSFLSIGTPNGLPPMGLLDSVSITQTTQVPEPASLAVLGIGLAGLGVIRRRRHS